MKFLRNSDFDSNKAVGAVNERVSENERRDVVRVEALKFLASRMRERKEHRKNRMKTAACVVSRSRKLVRATAHSFARFSQWKIILPQKRGGRGMPEKRRK